MKLKSSVAVTCFFPGRAKDLSAPLYLYQAMQLVIHIGLQRYAERLLAVL